METTSCIELGQNQDHVGDPNRKLFRAKWRPRKQAVMNEAKLRTMAKADKEESAT